jgi:hypothetical protein
MGFSGSDAEFLSSVAEKFIAYNRLSQRQTQCVAKSLARYSGQLMEFLDGAKKPVQSAKCDCRNGEFCPYCDPDRFGNDPDRTC